MRNPPGSGKISARPYPVHIMEENICAEWGWPELLDNSEVQSVNKQTVDLRAERGGCLGIYKFPSFKAMRV